MRSDESDDGTVIDFQRALEELVIRYIEELRHVDDREALDRISEAIATRYLELDQRNGGST